MIYNLNRRCVDQCKHLMLEPGDLLYVKYVKVLRHHYRDYESYLYLSGYKLELQSSSYQLRHGVSGQNIFYTRLLSLSTNKVVDKKNVANSLC